MSDSIINTGNHFQVRPSQPGDRPETQDATEDSLAGGGSIPGPAPALAVDAKPSPESPRAGPKPRSRPGKAETETGPPSETLSGPVTAAVDVPVRANDE